MRRLFDIDIRRQAKPQNKEMTDTGTRKILAPGYVTQVEFDEMQIELREQLEEQTTVLEQALLELKQMKLHLASMSQEDIEPGDVEE